MLITSEPAADFNAFVEPTTLILAGVGERTARRRCYRHLALHGPGRQGVVKVTPIEANRRIDFALSGQGEVDCGQQEEVLNRGRQLTQA